MNRTRSASLATRQVTITPRWLVDAAGFDPATCSLQGRIASLVHERPERAACAAPSLMVLLSSPPPQEGTWTLRRAALRCGSWLLATRCQLDGWQGPPLDHVSSTRGRRGSRGLVGRSFVFRACVGMDCHLGIKFSLTVFLCGSACAASYITLVCSCYAPARARRPARPGSRGKAGQQEGQRKLRPQAIASRKKSRCGFLLALRFVRLSRARQ